MPTLFHNQQPFINLYQIFIKQPFIDLFEIYSKPLYYQNQAYEPESGYQTQAMPESDNRTKVEHPESDNQTKEDEPKSDYPDLGYRTLRKSERINNNLALNNKDLYKGNIKQL